jgi:hypothetical protein
MVKSTIAPMNIPSIINKNELSHLERNKNQNSSSEKQLRSSLWRNDERIFPFWEKATFSNRHYISKRSGKFLEIIGKLTFSKGNDVG